MQLNDASFKVVLLLRKLEVKINGFSEMVELNRQFIYSNWVGLYNAFHDVIGINYDNLPYWGISNQNELDNILLHELSHWSGHPSRLARPVALKHAELIHASREANALEECVAQYSAFYLSQALGLDYSFHWEKLRNYKTLFPSTDYYQAERLGLQASEFILNEAEQRKVA